MKFNLFNLLLLAIFENYAIRWLIQYIRGDQNERFFAGGIKVRSILAIVTKCHFIKG